MKKITIASTALGSALVAGIAFSPLASAADNPFSTHALKDGYQLAQAETKAKDGKCGEAKCGAEKKAAERRAAEKKADGNCGAAKNAEMPVEKKQDGSCGANKK